MPDIYPSRVVLIDLLVDNDLNDWFSKSDMADYFSYLLRTGIKGYDYWTDQELIDECISREINMDERMTQ